MANSLPGRYVVSRHRQLLGDGLAVKRDKFSGRTISEGSGDGYLLLTVIFREAVVVSICIYMEMDVSPNSFCDKPE
jgi:hypothetical protein